MKQTLYEIADDFDALNEMMEEMGGDVSDPMNLEAYRSFVSELESNLMSKADDYARVISDALARSEGIKTEMDRLSTLRKHYTNKAARLKKILEYVMRSTGVTKFDTQLHQFGIVKAGGKLKLEVTVRPEELPPVYHVHKIDTNMEELRKDVEAGKEIKGVILHERGEYLKIR